MTDQSYYDFQQVIGLLERIAIATERMANTLDEISAVQEEDKFDKQMADLGDSPEKNAPGK